MTAKEKVAIIFFVVTLITAFLLWMSSGIKVQFNNGNEVDVEVVKEPLEITTGLMFRDKLKTGKGMLFSYGRDEHHSIWMKNMNFPIDIIWIDSNNKIVHVTGNVQPCVKEPCPVFTPADKARYVLEVNANFAEQNGITAGQEVVIFQPSLF